ncbi:MAG: MBL fold metallo-hydrolase [candidate division KSB1 bacterium]|nr:MBL fold metallo-hydrolase [candidate division KSB1 bacterium]MDZ7275348.1 MBL fold metallo-hydrolase [candidate division KSB1 bacterium]MDZ7287515.1 MBL fold metallo-hydrolase [candidate division KSB1 bacterium]MDZ7299629.1 MBL fold metallo-hydrolase [candidate division KSB1 bacterium]MDZ7307422.1 MBL fold metallo-hydrolase [candidate division KSB1 bacterium]
MAALKWHRITVGPFAMNAYVLWDEPTRAGILIDPGDEIDRIAEVVAAHAVQLQRIVLTHAHLDHVLHCRSAQERFQLPVYLHREDLPLLQNMGRQAAMLGFPLGQIPPPQVAGFLAEGDTLLIGREQLQVRHGPGHSPGSLLLIGEKLAVVGDVLFRGSIGRTDLPGGSYETLMKTITEKLLVLEDGVVVLPGHGGETTIGFERRHNPFLQPGSGLFDIE